MIEADLAVLADLARLAERHLPDASLYSLSALVEEFRRTIRRELDLAREGHIIERVTAQFAGDPTVRFPRIYWPLTCESVLTLEYLDGVKVSAVGTAAAPQLDPVVVAARGADFVFRQILVHGLFRRPPPRQHSRDAGQCRRLHRLRHCRAAITQRVRRDGLLAIGILRSGRL